MVSLSASEMDKLYKNETILDHKEKMIDKLKEKMTEMQLNIDLVNAKKQGVQIQPHQIPNLASLSPSDRKRHEDALGRDETFAKYSAIAKQKHREREKERIRLQDLALEREKEIAKSYRLQAEGLANDAQRKAAVDKVFIVTIM